MFKWLANLFGGYYEKPETPKLKEIRVAKNEQFWKITEPVCNCKQCKYLEKKKRGK